MTKSILEEGPSLDERPDVPCRHTPECAHRCRHERLGTDTVCCSTAFPRVLLRPITVVNIPILLHDSECLSTLKWEVEFNPAVYPVMKCLRVLIATFERQIKAIDWHLN